MPTAGAITLWGRVAQGCGWPAKDHRLHPRGGEEELHHLLTTLPPEYWLLTWNKFSELLVAGNGLVSKEVPAP